MMEVVIVIILKPEKDPALFHFYHPISLLNIHTNLGQSTGYLTNGGYTLSDIQ